MRALLTAGFVLGLSVAAPVGPVGAATIRAGMEQGAREAFLLGLGAATVDFFYLALVCLGVAPLLLRIPFLVPAFYAGGALLLGQMAWVAFRRAYEGGLPAPAAGAAGRGSFLYGLGITALNPATIISWVGMGGAFASAYLQGLTPLTALAALLSVFAGSAVWFGVLALAAGSAGRLAVRRPWIFRVVNGVAGCTLAGFAVAFAVKVL